MERAQYRKAGADAPVFTRLRLGLCEAWRPLWHSLEKSNFQAARRAVRASPKTDDFPPLEFSRPCGKNRLFEHRPKTDDFAAVGIATALLEKSRFGRRTTGPPACRPAPFQMVQNRPLEFSGQHRRAPPILVAHRPLTRPVAEAAQLSRNPVCLAHEAAHLGDPETAALKPNRRHPARPKTWSHN